MIHQTFCHLRGIGPGTERQLWGRGLRCWDDVTPHTVASLSPTRRERLLEGCERSRRAMAAGDAAWFDRTLPSKERWRLFPTFQQGAAYLDIETTGLDARWDQVTTVAVYDGVEVMCFVQGDNLDELPACLERFPLLITYNGATFDLPFLRQQLGIPLDQAHLDLRYVLSSLGYRGGLKACERALGLDRGELADVDGYLAVLLWHDYQRGGDPRVLETLLAYNVADVLNLAALAPSAINRKLADTPFADQLRLPEPLPLSNPYTAHKAVLDRYRDRVLG
jgi:uncharacterized protein YprB with RNaseH-like and TPR domain